MVQELRQESVEFLKVIYYRSSMQDKKAQEELMEDFEENSQMDDAQVDTNKSFLDCLDELYHNPDIVFLMDYDLKGDMGIEDFFD